MTIHIEDLIFECIIGILDVERTTAQKVVLNLQIDYVYEEEYFINYADVIALIEENMLQNKYMLLETALTELEKVLLLTFPLIERLNIKITKPNIIDNAKVSLSKNFLYR